jgi:hypothetical protein
MQIYSGNMYCPCGSNLKYKNCCQAKGIQYYRKNNGQLVKRQALTPEQRQAFNEQRQKFIAENGREPDREERALLLAANYQNIESLIENDLLKSGASPESVYAFHQTGLLVTAENRRQIAPEELKRWDDAIAEYRAGGGASLD